MSMSTRPLAKADYDEIVQVIDRWWGGPTSALAHPIFFYELGRLARVVESDGLLVGFLLRVHLPGRRRSGTCTSSASTPTTGAAAWASSSTRRSRTTAAARAASELKAITTLGNEASVRFHLALGWTMSEVEDYAGPGRMRIVFTRELAER